MTASRPIGLGDATQDGVSELLASQADPSLMQSAITTALQNNVPESTVATIGGAIKVYNTVQPAVNLMASLASGQKVDPTTSMAQTVTALAGVASLINPAAGAIIGVVGGAVVAMTAGLEALSNAAGAMSISPTYTYTGFIRNGVDIIPFGPADSYWIKLNTISELDAFYLGGDGGKPPGRPPFFCRARAPQNTSADDGNYALYTIFHVALYEPMSWEEKVLYEFGHSVPVNNGAVACETFTYSNWVSATTTPGLTDKTQTGVTQEQISVWMYAPNAFDIFLCTLMQQNMKLWANAQPSIQPLDLLHAAAQVWNAHHDSSATKTYSAFTSDDYARFDNYQLRGTPWPLASLLLSGDYGPAEQGVNYPRTNSQPITANLGPAIAGGSSTGGSSAAPSTSTTHSLAVAAVGIPAAAGVAGVIYALATRQAIGTVFGKAWGSLRGWAGDAAGMLKRNPLEAWEETRATTVQTLLFPREEFTRSSAKAWARSHGYRGVKADVRGQFVRVRQIDPKAFQQGSFRTIDFGGSGIKAVIGRLR